MAEALFEQPTGLEIAVIGMAGRFPGAASIAAYWENLRNAVESIARFDDATLQAAGVDPALLANPRYVKAGAVLGDIEYFDAAFFGYNPREAEMMDPQQRFFLECAWEALEHAGYDPERYHGSIGVYAGCSANSYLIHNLYANPAAIRSVAEMQLLICNDRDFLATQVSYKLNLEGPSVVIQSACSTSLVAIHLACQSLLSGECDMVLAGGVSIGVPHTTGYLYQENGILSPDGHCRTFSAQAQGTVAGSGVGIVVLKRLDDALADRDTIHAVIKGSAINNDGGRKAGYTAPRTEGQARVIRAAQRTAGVDASTIDYIEAHGTGTALGDPIEISALTQAFRANGATQQRCAIGSVKTNIGHLDACAGVAGLIKTVLALKHGQIPPSLHFDAPNPTIDFANSPFYVATELREWRRNGHPRRAGVSSFGIGGTNAHIVLEEAPPASASAPARHWQLLPISARSVAALDQATQNLANYLRQHPEISLADVAYTLQMGRRTFAHRRVLICRDYADALELIERPDPKRVHQASGPLHSRPLVFMFPGQGAQYPGMTQGLYQTEPLFREVIDTCAAQLKPHLGLDLRSVLYPELYAERNTSVNAADQLPALEQTALAQPALFVVEYALAKLWMAWGLQPTALIGHSVGEYVAACLAGVVSLNDALALVAARGRLMQACAPGKMLAVALSEAELTPLLNDQLALAAVNGPQLCVVAGPSAAVTDFAQQLTQRGIHCRPLHTSHAFHSPLMEPVLAPFAALLSQVQLHAPQLPYISNLTGTWISAAQATNPAYWTQQLRQPVRFATGIAELLREEQVILLELGPGQTLSTFARQQIGTRPDQMALSTLRHPQDQSDDRAVALGTLGALWLAGVPLEWERLSADEPRQRVPLPSYPFERQRYWIEASQPVLAHGSVLAAPAPEHDGMDVALPNSLHNRPNLHSSYVAPRNELEEQIAAIYQQLFGFEQIGVYDNFFELGGHSLLALQLTFQLRETFKVELTLGNLFAHSSVAELAEYIAAEQHAVAQALHPAAALLPRITPDLEQRYQPFPTTDIQQAYWIGRNALFDLGNVGSHFYVEFECGSIDVARYSQAIHQVIARHEMLRTIIRADGQQQTLAEVPTYQLASYDLRGRADAETQLLALRQELTQTVLNPAQWPLFDLRVSHISDEHTRLHVKIDFLVADALGIEIILHELAQFYTQPDLQLPPLELSYRDYMVTVAQLQGSDLYLRSQEYWHNRIKTLPPPPQLAQKHSRDALAHPCLKRRGGSLDPERWNLLKARASRLGLTPSGIVCALYSEVLAAWSEQPHFTLNLTLFNRLPLHPQVDRIVGDFTSTTLLEINASGETFAERAKRLQAQLWRDMDHQYFSGVRVLRDLNRIQGRPASSAMPLVFTSLLTQRGVTPDAGPAWLGQPGYSSSQSPQILIDHQVGERNGALIFVWDVMEEVFPPGMIDAMFAAFEQLLNRMIDEEEAWQEEYPLLLPATELAARERANATIAPLPDALLQQLFARQVALQPDHCAVIAPAHRLSYAELRSYTLRVGRQLREAGARPNTLVAVVMEKGWEQVVAVLGVLEAGAAYLPLDPELPQERLWYVLEHGQVQHVLTQPWIAGKLNWPAGLQICCIGNEPWPGDDTPLEPVQRLNDLAYVIYTSGSTGLPKGVMIDHAGAVNTIIDINQRFAIGPEDRVLALSSLSFDLSVYDIFGTLAAGGTIVMPAPEASRDAAAWATLLRQHQVTIWNSVPALLQMLVEHAAGDATRIGASLRLAMLSGDWIPLHLPDQIRALLPALAIYSLGGATEASIWSILYPIEAIDPAWKSIPYGVPMLNQRFQVLDAHFNPRPVWVPGMLYIAGIGLAQGYWRDAEKTAASFVYHPRTGERLYHTGDLGCYLPDGTIEFLGRADYQVKIQGYRVEIGEIEAALAQHAAVQVAVVDAVGSRHGSRRLVAYVVPSAEQALSTADAQNLLISTLRDFLHDKLPAYMVPSSFVLLSALPLSPNGKVDRKALPAPAAENISPAADLIAPRTPSEQRLAQIWAKLLDQPQIGVQSNFFDLGGDSLLATQLITQIRVEFQVELALRSLFEHPEIETLAAQIDQAQARSQLRQLPPLQPVERMAQMPVSFAQQRLWFLEQLEPGNPANLIPAVLRLNGSLDVTTLAQAINAVVQRHEALRSSFASAGGQPVQMIAPSLTLPLPLIDLSNLDDFEREQAAQELIENEMRQPFDLGQAPLLRSTLLRLAANEHILLLTFHHIIADGWSLGIFLRELMQFYHAAPQQPSLPALPVHYADFAVWQRQWLQGEALEALLGYWQRQLADLPIFELPSDRMRPPVRSSNGAIYSFMLPPDVSSSLRSFSQRNNLTLFMTLLAMYNVLLLRHSGQEDVVLGSNIANRTHPEIEGLIGFFANTIVLRSDLSGNPSFRELVQRVRAVTLAAQAHQEMPFELLVAALQPERDPARTPLFQVMFVLQNMQLDPGEQSSLQLSPLEVGSQAAKFDLTLFMQDTPEGIGGNFEYSSDLFEAATIARLTEHFQAIAAAVASDPDQRIADLPLALEPADQLDDFYR